MVRVLFAILSFMHDLNQQDKTVVHCPTPDALIHSV